MKGATGPVIPHYRMLLSGGLYVVSIDINVMLAHFLDKITALYEEKDHAKRLSATSTTRIHKDVSLHDFGAFDTSDKMPPVSASDAHNLRKSVDLTKYEILHTAVKEYQKSAQEDYDFSGVINRDCFGLKLHLMGMSNFQSLPRLENTVSAGYQKGSLNETSRLIETRMIEAWALQSMTETSCRFLDKQTIRDLVLQDLFMLTRE